MKTTTLFIASVVLLLAPAAAQDSISLTIVHTNDTHSCIRPLSPLNPDTAFADKGGYVRRATLLNQLRSEAPGLLLFDSGDFSQGSAFYNLYKGETEVKLMNQMGYDAAAIGNHEFDYGLENMARVFSMANFPIVCANYHFEGTPLDTIVKPYVVLRRGQIKIGVFGLGTQLEGMVAKSNYGSVTYEDPAAAANRTANILKNQLGCDLIVCLSHLGWQEEGTTDDNEVIPLLHNVDIILGGHSHSYFTEPETAPDADGHTVYINQMGKYGRFVGVLELHLQPLQARVGM